MGHRCAKVVEVWGSAGLDCFDSVGDAEHDFGEREEFGVCCGGVLLVRVAGWVSVVDDGFQRAAFNDRKYGEIHEIGQIMTEICENTEF